MLIVYHSLTGNVRRFVAKTGLPAREMSPVLFITEPFVLVTPTTGFGDVPHAVASFLPWRASLLRGVAVSGNRNWGPNYARAADIISAQYDVPILLRFELAGTDADVRKFTEEVRLLDEKSYRTE